MLPPGTLQTLIRRYQAARAKMEELGAEVAAALSLPGQSAPRGEPPPAKKRGSYAPRVTNGEGDAGRGPGSWRVDQVIAAVRKNGPSTARDIVRLLPDCTMSSAYTILGRAVQNRILVRTGKGTYAVADSHAALPAIMRQAIKKKTKKEGKPAPVQLLLRSAPGGGVSQQQRIIDLAEKKGGALTVSDVIEAGISSKRKLAQQNLSRAVELGRFTKVGPGQYALKKTPAG